jgi:hypothetical protein
MSDPSIPWVAFEYDEWGDANDPKFFEYMKGYCPITNIQQTAYPNFLVTTGSNQILLLEINNNNLKTKQNQNSFLMFFVVVRRFSRCSCSILGTGKICGQITCLQNRQQLFIFENIL